MDCSGNKLLDEIHVLRLVRNSNRVSRSVPPHHARNWNRISWPRASPQVHRAEIWRVGRVQTLDHRSDNGPMVQSLNSAHAPYLCAVNLWASSWPRNPVPITSMVRRNSSRNAIGVANQPENMYLVEKLIPRTIHAVVRATSSRLGIMPNRGDCRSLSVVPVRRRSIT